MVPVVAPSPVRRLQRGMRLGAHSFIWTGRFCGAEEAAFAEAAECGFDGLEITLADAASINWDGVARFSECYGIEVLLCLTQKPGLSLASPDGAIRSAAVAHVAAVMEHVRSLGSDLLTGPMLNAVGALSGMPPTDAERGALQESFKALGDLAERRAVRLAVEPLNRFQGYLMTRVADGLALCRGSGSDRVGLLLDLFHMNIEEHDPASSIRQAAERCFHVHVSACDRGIPGTDKTDWTALRDALSFIGYRGWITVEAFGFTEAEPAAKAHLWHPPPASPRRIAEESAAHIRRVFGSSPVHRPNLEDARP